VPLRTAAVVAVLIFVVCSCVLAVDAVGGSANPTVTVPLVGSDYRLQIEDIIQINVWGEQTLSNIQLIVTPDGKVSMPHVGNIQAEGLTLSELRTQVVAGLAEKEIVYDANVSVTLIRAHEKIVRVVGQVNRPGAYTIREGDTLMDALAMAGSYTETGWLEKATVTRKDSDSSIPVDLRKLFAGDLSLNMKVLDGDTIYIPEENYENKIYVLGQVMRPGIYPLKERMTVLSALSIAGGPTPQGTLRATTVIRGNAAKPEKVSVDLTKLIDKADISQDVVLQPGDVVVVPESKKPDWGKMSQIFGVLSSLSYIRRYGLF